MESKMCLCAFAALAVLCTAAPGYAQYDSQAAEPVTSLRGTLILSGGGTAARSAAMEAFAQNLTGRSSARARQATTQDGGEERTVYILAGPGVPNGADEHTFLQAIEGIAVTRILIAGPIGVQGFDAQQLTAARGVWITAGAHTQHMVGTPINTALAAVLANGGIVAAEGEAAMALGHGGLDLLAGALIETGFDPRPGAELLVSIGKRPPLVGLGIPADATMILKGRRLSAVSKMGVHLYLPPSETRGLQHMLINGRERADWIALTRSARARSLPPYPAAQPPTPEVAHGALILAGGGGLGADIIKRFIELAGGPEAPIVYIPCTQNEEVRGTPGTVELLRRHGAKNVSWIHTKDRDAANSSPEILDPLRRAKGIWFGGGRQWNLVDSYQNTKAHELMHDVLERGGVIAGSSAGASIQAGYLARGDPLGNLNIIAEGYERGLGFLCGVAVDQHFSQRGRHGDMSELVGTFPQLLGIGLDEGTALIVRGSIGEVMGPENRAVFFFDTTRETQPGEQDYVSVKPGQLYDLATRTRGD